MNQGLLLIWLCFILCGCNSANDDKVNRKKSTEEKKTTVILINRAHFNHLYKEVTLPNEKEAAIIHIYSKFPDYSYDIEPKEGFTCVDDVARAIVFLSKEEDAKNQMAKLIEFLLYMQNENGWFNNFVRKDLSINTTYKTTIAQPDWWSWRALWALESGLLTLGDRNPDLTTQMEISVSKLVANIKTYLSSLPQKEKRINGIPVPSNLPYGSASDQASVLLIGLTQYYKRTKDHSVIDLMRQLSDGIIKMQIEIGELKGMFLSWENVWHAYGNCQSYALLLVGDLLQEVKYKNAALMEIDFYYPYLQQNGFLELMSVASVNNDIIILNKNEYPQISYGIRPIIFACAEAFRQTGKIKYKEYALKWFSWFTGSNDAVSVMYDPNTGRCFDGILSKSEINKNSGAESTIEALLSIQAVKSIFEKDKDHFKSM